LVGSTTVAAHGVAMYALDEIVQPVTGIEIPKKPFVMIIGFSYRSLPAEWERRGIGLTDLG
jgi:hypothetical protein